MSIINRTKIKDNISKMHNIEQMELFKLFIKHNVKYSSNKNGVFINISKVDDQILQIIQEHILFYQKNNQTLEKDNIIRKSLKDDEN